MASDARQDGDSGGSVGALPLRWESAMQAIIRHSPAGITVQSRDGRILFANESAARLIGFPDVESLLATSVTELMRGFQMLDEKGFPLPVESLPGRKAMLGERAGPTMIRFRLVATGESRWSMVEATPIFEDGKVEAVLNVFRDVTSQVRAQESMRFLLDASALLSTSLEYAATLEHLARLVVPMHADWCTIHIDEPDGTMRQIVAHADDSKVEMARDAQRKYPFDRDARTGVAEVLRTGKAQFIPVVTDEMIVAAAKDAEHLALIREVGLSSIMIVPLIARDHVLGAITFIASDPGKRYDEHDLHFAEDLALRAAIAVDNARLYVEAQREIAERKRAEEQVRVLNEQLEARVQERTRELEESNRVLSGEIAERKRAEEREHANFLRVKSILDSLPLGAVALDESRRILHANVESCRQLGIVSPPASLIGRTEQEFLSEARHKAEKPQELAALLSDALSAVTEPRGGEIRLSTGNVLFLLSAPIIVANHHHGHLLLFRDVTQERRTDAAKTEFMSLASHQLRTPLTAIRWTLGRLAKSMEAGRTEAQAALLEKAKASVTRMADTVNTMLAISSIEAGKTTPKSAAIALKPFLDDLAAELREDVHAKSLQLELHCPLDAAISSDPSLLKEAVGNLVGNAVKYTPAGGRVRVEVARAGSLYHIRIEDTGYGIPAYQQEKIFSKFFRGDNIVDKDPDGTGLGLYLVHELVTVLGGSIDFSSREGEGSVFTLVLPAELPSPKRRKGG